MVVVVVVVVALVVVALVVVAVPWCCGARSHNLNYVLSDPPQRQDGRPFTRVGA